MIDTAIDAQFLTDFCQRIFPHRDQQYVTAVNYMGAWQHEMTSFTLGWRDRHIWRTEPLILRRFKSRLSWWQVDDRLKARREATVMRWLHEEGVPVARVHGMDSPHEQDFLLQRRLPGSMWFDINRDFPQAVAPYIDEYARLLALVHSLEVPFAVQNVVPHVTLKSVLQTIRGWAERAEDKRLLQTISYVAEQAEQAIEVRPCILHGDYHFANVMLHEGGISGIIDWEFSAYGDPRWDVVAAYQLLIEFEAASAADRFLNVYIEESGRSFDGPPLWNVVIPLQAWALSAWLRAEVISGRTFGFRMAEVLGDQYEEREARVIEALAYLG
jgi:aminoglycoside phosphotransferase (APT) family kinase protein